MSYSDEFVAREFPACSKELQKAIQKHLAYMEECYTHGINVRTSTGAVIPISDFIQFAKDFIEKYPIEFADASGKTDKSKMKPGQRAILLRHSAIDLSRNTIPTKEEDYVSTMYTDWAHKFMRD